MAGDFDKEKLVKMERSVVLTNLCIVIVMAGEAFGHVWEEWEWVLSVIFP